MGVCSAENPCVALAPLNPAIGEAPGNQSSSRKRIGVVQFELRGMQFLLLRSVRYTAVLSTGVLTVAVVIGQHNDEISRPTNPIPRPNPMTPYPYFSLPEASSPRFC